MDVQKYIKELLFSYDCIILPEFGGFIMHYVPAEIHPVTNKFLPPSKTIAFNEQLNVNDGLLVSYIVREANKTQEDAAALVKDFVKGLKNHLATFNLYILKDVGRFFFNSHNHLEFEPENSINYLEESFGLTELYSKPIERNFSDMSKIPPRIVKPARIKPPVKKQASAPKSGKVEDDKFLIDVDGETEKKSFSMLLLIPLLLMVCSMGLLFYINHTGRSLASIFPGKGSRQTETKELAQNTVPEESALMEQPEIAPEQNSYSSQSIVAESTPAEVNIAPKEPIKKATENLKTTEIKTKTKTVVSDNAYNYNIVSLKTGKYFIIVGSFAEKVNAFKMNKKIIRTGGIPVIIAPDESNKYYKVAVEDFTDVNAAIAKLDAYKPKFGDGVWVMAY